MLTSGCEQPNLLGAGIAGTQVAPFPAGSHDMAKFSQRRDKGEGRALPLPVWLPSRTLGQHGLNVAPAVLAEDERLGAPAAPLRPLLILSEGQDRRVHDHALAVDDELLRHLVRLVILLRTEQRALDVVPMLQCRPD